MQLKRSYGVGCGRVSLRAGVMEVLSLKSAKG